MKTLQTDALQIHVVDDDDKTRQQISLVARIYGIKVNYFSETVSTIDLLSHSQTQVYFICIKPTNTLGLDTIKDIKYLNDKYLNECPIIAMSAYNDVDIALKAMHLGVTDVLLKPFTRHTFTEQLKTLSLLR